VGLVEVGRVTVDDLGDGTAHGHGVVERHLQRIGLGQGRRQPPHGGAGGDDGFQKGLALHACTPGRPPIADWELPDEDVDKKTAGPSGQTLAGGVEKMHGLRRPGQRQGLPGLHRLLARGPHRDLLAAHLAAQHHIGAQVFQPYHLGGTRASPDSATASGRSPSQAAPVGAGKRTLLPAIAPSCSCTRFIAGVPMKRAAKVVAGWAYRARGVAHCSTRPWCSSTTWSAMLMASAWSCVTYTTVRPRRCCSSRSSARISWRSWASRLDRGSSIRQTWACATRARPRATRCCWPPESWPGLRSSRITDCP